MCRVIRSTWSAVTYVAAQRCVRVSFARCSLGQQRQAAESSRVRTCGWQCVWFNVCANAHTRAQSFGTTRSTYNSRRCVRLKIVIKSVITNMHRLRDLCGIFIHVVREYITYQHYIVQIMTRARGNSTSHAKVCDRHNKCAKSHFYTQSQLGNFRCCAYRIDNRMLYTDTMLSIV